MDSGIIEAFFLWEKRERRGGAAEQHFKQLHYRLRLCLISSRFAYVEHAEFFRNFRRFLSKRVAKRLHSACPLLINSSIEI